MLSSISSNRKGAFASAKATSHDAGSQENILKDSHDGAIVKSVTYTVHIDEEK